MRKRPLLTEAEKKERQRACQVRWRKNNPDYHKKWAAANKEYIKLKKREYRVRKEKERENESIDNTPIGHS